MNQYHNIPAELRQRPQWVVCGDDKNLRNPRTSAQADVNDPSTWGSFDEACNNGLRHIGFVFTSADPYCGIDIDDKKQDPASEAEYANHQVILKHFVAYTEQSIGERWVDDRGRERGGYHILIRGRIEQGRDHAHVGVYSHSRFFTFTGRVVRNAPIVDYQPLLDQLVAGMPAYSAAALDDYTSDLSDAEVHEMARNASNGQKYDALCACTCCTGVGVHKTHGSYMQLGYESQSHADFALLSIIAFYTRDNAQVRRIFRCTGLGKRDKATRNDVYLNKSLVKIRSNEPVEADFVNMRQDVQRMFGNHSTDPVMDAALAKDVAYLTSMGQDAGTSLLQMDLVPAMLEADAPVKAVAPTPPPAAAPRAPAPPVAVAPAPPRTAPAAPSSVVVTGDMPATAWDLVPPGLVGEVAQYIYSSAVRPVREVALASAMGFVAGLAGRSYNVSGTGLNQYLLLVAGTGTGKEDGPKGVERLLSALRPSVPAIDDFVGPGAFASGQGLIRTLDQQPSVFSMMGEIGHTLQMLNDPRAPSSMQLLKRALLDLYSKSGWNNVLRSTAYSDMEKNTKTVFAPSLSFVGDTTPEKLFGALTTDDIADGLLPRMTIIEYKGKRPSRNRANGQSPELAVLEHLASLAQSALTMRNDHRNMPVPADAGGQLVLDQYDHTCDERMRADSAGLVNTQLWNRAHLKALKVAALLAVGINHHNPVITQSVAQWAIEFVERTTYNVLTRFDEGDIGNGDSKLRNDIKRLIDAYFKLSSKQLLTYRSKKDWRDAGVVPYAFLAMRTSSMASFTTGYTTATQKLREVLDTMVAIEWLGVMHKTQAREKFGTQQALYYLGAGWPEKVVLDGKLVRQA